VVRQVALDTADVAQHVREILSSNNIGQRLFARHVLGLSQARLLLLLATVLITRYCYLLAAWRSG